MIFFLSHWRSSISWWFFVLFHLYFACCLWSRGAHGFAGRSWDCVRVLFSTFCNSLLMLLLPCVCMVLLTFCIKTPYSSRECYFLRLAMCFHFFFFLPTLLLLLLSIDRDANILLAFISTKHLAAQIVTTCAAFWATFSTVLGGPRM